MPPSRIPGPRIPLVAAYRFFTDSFMTPLAWHRQYGNLVNVNANQGGAIVAFGPEYNRQALSTRNRFRSSCR